MRRIVTLSFAFAICVVLAVSCKKEAKQTQAAPVPQEVIDKIHQLGFTTKDVSKDENGYLVEGDIIITDKELRTAPSSQFLRIGQVEQYRTTNLVDAGASRSISVSLSSQLPTSYVAALDEALARYNALNLSITFRRVSSSGEIQIVKGNGSYLASAGFPSGGDPYGQIKANARAIGAQPQATVASILAHEIGHCIGFRHTDYMDRSYSCGGAVSNEGASTVGAINIPGTPVTADPNSWMLACIGSGQNRPFNANDRTALGYLY